MKFYIKKKKTLKILQKIFLEFSRCVPHVAICSHQSPSLVATAPFKQGGVFSLLPPGRRPALGREASPRRGGAAPWRWGGLPGTWEAKKIWDEIDEIDEMDLKILNS